MPLPHPEIVRAAPGLVSYCGGSARGDGLGLGNKVVSGGGESLVEGLELFASLVETKGGAPLLGR